MPRITVIAPSSRTNCPVRRRRSANGRTTRFAVNAATSVQVRDQRRMHKTIYRRQRSIHPKGKAKSGRIWAKIVEISRIQPQFGRNRLTRIRQKKGLRSKNMHGFRSGTLIEQHGILEIRCHCIMRRHATNAHRHRTPRRVIRAHMPSLKRAMEL